MLFEDAGPASLGSRIAGDLACILPRVAERTASGTLCLKGEWMDPGGRSWPWYRYPIVLMVERSVVEEHVWQLRPDRRAFVEHQ